MRVSVQGQTAAFGLPFAPQLNFTCEDCAGLPVGGSTTGGLSFGATVPDTSGDVKNGDAENFEDGYITIVPIQGDLTAKSPNRFKSVINSFSY